jgi:hypothetical protein
VVKWLIELIAMIDKNNGVQEVCISGEGELIFNTSILANV